MAVDRRAMLQLAGAGIAGAASLPATVTGDDTDGGDERWRFKTDHRIISSPTVVDGTAFVGSSDHNLYAVDAGVDDSSTDSRIRNATSGHHNSTVSESNSLIAGDAIPGFGLPSVLTDLGAAGYLFHRRRTQMDTE